MVHINDGDRKIRWCTYTTFRHPNISGYVNNRFPLLS
jgi:hypothetical protein